jgi:anhydro-N-acetylmuramic acid kinase
MKSMNVIGLMSGTSLDGVDIAFCRFSGNPIKFELIRGHTFPYPCGIKSQLADAENLSGSDLNTLNIELGQLYGNMIKNFINAFMIKKIDLVASHGHTIFHEPNKNITLQIGHPAYIAVNSGLTTVADFRSADVFLGGQGAPLVPIGDKNLFSEYKNRLNLGGFANISFEKNNATIAFDICPANIPLNLLADEMGYSYDDEGLLAASGKTNPILLEELNDLDYYKQQPPKSLGREWFNQQFWPLIKRSKSSNIDKLRTITEHIAQQCANSFKKGNVLITGGGAHNTFLVNRIKDLSNNHIITPAKTIIDYKEALIFAYLGYLRINQKNNTLSSVTGAKKSHSSGAVYLP